MRFQGGCYRAHDPQWAWSPTSGAGAAVAGGRFNWPGLETLYLATRLETAVKETTHGFAQRLNPLTLCEYDVDCEDIADLRLAQELDLEGVSFDALACPWSEFMRVGETPPSWLAVRALLASGYAGMWVPSFANGATRDDTNLVLWDWADTPPHKVAVYDPYGRLPRNNLSWT